MDGLRGHLWLWLDGDGKPGFLESSVLLSFRPNRSLNPDPSRLLGFGSGFKTLLQKEAVFCLSYGNAQVGAFLSCPAEANVHPKSASVSCPRAKMELGHGGNPQGCVHSPKRRHIPTLMSSSVRLHGSEPIATVSVWDRQRAFTAGTSWQNPTWGQNPTASVCSSLPAPGLFSGSAPSPPLSPTCVSTDLRGKHSCLPPAPLAEMLPSCSL